MTTTLLKPMIQPEDPALFVDRGLRDYFSYRDLGIGQASSGRIVAQINCANRALNEEGELHHHVVGHQWNLILKGWAKMKFEGTGEVYLAEGSSIHMPPNIKHTFVSCSEDFATLEVCTPADFKTVEDPPEAYDEAAQLSQQFSMQTAEDGVFETQGLRSYLSYRDLGIAKATNGAILAHLIKAEYALSESSEEHYHILDDQFVYVLKGWSKVRFEDDEEHIMDAGTCFYQPSEIRHTFLACSEDFLALEVCLPADFETVAV